MNLSSDTYTTFFPVTRNSKDECNNTKKGIFKTEA